MAAAGAVKIAAGGAFAIAGASDRPVVFAGSTGTLELGDARGFTGVVSGLSGEDAIDLADIPFSADTRVTFLGNASGGALTISDGAETAKIALAGDYLSSTWTLASDGKGGVTVVDPVVSTNWQTLKVGAGGFVRGLDIDPDGTMVGRTDTNGAYIWNGTSWVQLVTSTSLPAAFVAANPVSLGTGVYEIQMAPSNSSIMYMMFDGYVFNSTNKGANWTQTSFAQVGNANANDSYAQNGQKMAVDPNNPNIVYVGTAQNGMFVSSDGGKTWKSVSAVPASKSVNGNYPGITGIVFDPAVGGVVGGVTQTIFAASYGNGVYESTNGGASWTALAGAPSEVDSAAVSSTGVYYAVDGATGTLWSYANGKWTSLVTNNSFPGMHAVAVDPTNPNEIVTVATNGSLNVSYDAGKTWTGDDSNSTETSSADIPWLSAGNSNVGQVGQAGYLSAGGLAFNPASPNELVLSAGTGVWTTTQVPASGMTNSTSVVWADQSVGIENLVANEVIVPPGGDPVLASWDRPFFYISNLNAYPSTYGPAASVNIVAGWSLDYASSNPSFVVGIADWWGTEDTGYSTNGGQTWTKFATEIPGAGSSFMGGTIAASTPNNIIWAPADGNQPYYTLNGGVTWKPISLPGVTSWGGFDYAYYFDQKSVAADRVLANTFYLYYNGVYETTNGGVSWTQKSSGQISPFSYYNSEIEAVPGEAGNLFFTGGIQGNGTNPPSYAGFYQSTNQGATWTAVPNVLDVITFGFGAAAPGKSYPAIYIVGYVNQVYGIWQSINQGGSWTQIGTQPAGELDQIKTISGDPNKFGQVYVGFSGGGYAYLSASASTQAPTVTVTSAGGHVSSSQQTISGTVDVADAGLGVTVYAGTTKLGTATSNSVTGAWSVSVTLAAGVNSITASAENASGNTGTSAAVQFDWVSTYTVAQYLANPGAVDQQAGGVNILDTAANVAAAIDALNADSHIASITLGDNGTLPLTAAQALGDTRALGEITNAATPIAIIDTAANIAAAIDALNADTHIASITRSDNGIMQLSVAQALDDTRALGEITNSAASIAILDTAANVAAAIDNLNADPQIASITLSDNGVMQLTVAQVLDDTRALGEITNATTALATAKSAASIAFLDAAANAAPASIAIVDTAAHVAAAIDMLNADPSIVSITLGDNGILPLTVAQALDDTQALGEITNATTSIAIFDTAANVTANLNALNSDADIASIALTGGGTLTLTLSLAQAFGDVAALAKVTSVHSITIADTAANLQMLTTAQIQALSSAGVTLLSALDQKVSLTNAQMQALGAADISIEEPYSGSSVEVMTFNSSGALESTTYSGLTGAYSSYTIDYGANGKAASASFSNGMTKTWTYGPGGSYVLAVAGNVGAAYTSYSFAYGTNGKPTSASFSNGMAETWTYSSQGSVFAVSGVTGAAYTSYSIDYGANGKATDASYNNGMTETWTYGSNGSYVFAVSGVTGAAYTSYSIDYGANGKPTNESFNNGTTETWTYASDGSYVFAATGVIGQAYTSYSNAYGANGKQTNAYYSNGTAKLWTYNSDSSYEINTTGVTGSSYSASESLTDATGAHVATTYNMVNGSGVLTLSASNLTINATSNTLGVVDSSDAFQSNTWANLTINASAGSSETFQYSPSFGQDTLSGFVASGSAHDVIQFGLSMFSYLNSTMSQAQDLSAVLANSKQAGANVTITDSLNDTLTVNQTTIASLSANPKDFRFV